MVNLVRCCSLLRSSANIAAISAHCGELKLLCPQDYGEFVPTETIRAWPIVNLWQAISEMTAGDPSYGDVAGGVSREDYSLACQLLHSIMVNKDESSSLAKALVICRLCLQRTYTATTGTSTSESLIDIDVPDMDEWSFSQQFTNLSGESDDTRPWYYFDHPIPPFITFGALMKLVESLVGRRVRSIRIETSGVSVEHTEDSGTNDNHIPFGVKVEVYYSL